ncbi:hypothetical protein N7486_008851 [Penicillium sp. IBT 16267x]|nr:hypothetical protein N7486_008851 [Penicillium sp. IBT 16267x]
MPLPTLSKATPCLFSSHQLHAFCPAICVSACRSPAMSPKDLLKLVTVNTAPERAKRVVGRLTAALADRYTIIHAANCETIKQVRPTVREIQPDLLFCASMWTLEQARDIQQIAIEEQPNVKTHAIPAGLHVERGPDGVVLYLLERVPQLIDGSVQGNDPERA